MAIVLVEGFDHYEPADATQKFWNGINPGNLADKTGRDGIGYAAVTTFPSSFAKQLPSTYPELIVGAAINLTGSLPSRFMNLRTSSDGLVAGLGVSGGFLTVTDAAANTYQGTTIVPLDSWFYVELKVTVGLTGAFELHLNEAVEIASTAGDFGSDDINILQFTSTVASETTHVDDVYALDTTGPGPFNDFLGDMKVKTLRTVADGTYHAWTPLAGTDHWRMVNDDQADGDGSYNSDATAGDKDSFIMEPLGLASTIYAVQMNISARKGDAGLRQIAPFVRQSGTDHAGSTYTLSTDYLFYSWLMEQDPTSADWDPSVLNADEFAVEVIA